MDANLIQMQAMLTAQGHLIELLLGANLANAKEPRALVETLRKILDQRFRFNMEASSNKSHLEQSAIHTAAVNHIHQILDSVRDRVSRPKRKMTKAKESIEFWLPNGICELPVATLSKRKLLSEPMNKRNATPHTGHDKCVIVSPLEIEQILHTLASQARLVTADVGGDSFFLTSVLAVDANADQVLIESSKHNPHKARILTGQRLLCATSLAKIKISFQLDSVVLATHDGQEAFLAPLPRELVRLQRREYYRISPRLLKSIEFSVSGQSKDAPATKKFDLLDISCGGISVITAPEIFAPELGAQYKCTLKLPGSEPLKTKVRVCDASRINANNKTSQRSGFQFIDLPEQSRATIQRYLMQLEFERSAGRARVK